MAQNKINYLINHTKCLIKFDSFVMEVGQNAVYQRIEVLKKYLLISSDQAFAKELGMRSAQTIYNIKKGIQSISKTMANAIVKKWPQIRYEWLMEGEGEMLEADKAETGAEYVPIEKTVLQTIISQQETIRMLTETVHSMSLKKETDAHQEGNAECVGAVGA